MNHFQLALYGKTPEDELQDATFLGTWMEDVRPVSGDAFFLTDMPNFPNEGATTWKVELCGYRVSPRTTVVIDCVMNPMGDTAEDALNHVRANWSPGDEDEDDRFLV